MAIAWSDVIVVAPELSTVPVALQNLILGYVNGSLNTDEFGDKFVIAASFLAAHMATMALRGGLGASGGPIGPVVSEYAGPVGKTYLNMFALWKGSQYYNFTVYGQEYAMIVSTLPANLGFVT